MEQNTPAKVPLNKGKIVGQKPALKLQDVWAIRVRLQPKKPARDLALLNTGIDSKLRGCNLVKLLVSDHIHGGQLVRRVAVVQQKIVKPVRIVVTEHARYSVQSWGMVRQLRQGGYLFSSRVHASLHLTTRQYAHIVQG